MILYIFRKKKKKTGETVADTLLPNETEAIIRPHVDVPQDLVERLGETCNRYIKTTLDASVDHLIKFLDMRIKVGASQRPKKYINNPSIS